MKKLVLISLTFVSGLLVWSCSKENPAPVFDPQVEITFVNPDPYAVTYADTKAGETAYEMKLSDVAVFVIPNSGADLGKVVYRAVFSASELASKRKIFSVDELPADARDDEYDTFDFYALANCGTTVYDGLPLGATRDQLKDLIDGLGGPASTGLTNYNNADYAKVLDGSGLRATGMLMAGVVANKALSGEGDGPTKPEIALLRTVSKVEVEAYTTETGDASGFDVRYPGSRVKVVSAKVVKVAPGTTLLDQGTTNYKVPSGLTAWSDAAVTTAEQPSSGNTEAGGSGNSAKNLFYLYPNGGRTQAGPMAADYEPVLELKTIFYVEPNDQVGAPITYEIPLAGALKAADDTNGDGKDNGEQAFGLFLRNGHYKVNVAISGLTESEVVADVTVANWDNVETQTVNIGQ